MAKSPQKNLQPTLAPVALATAATLVKKAQAVVGPIYSIADIFKDPQYIARDTITTVDDPRLGRVRTAKWGPRLIDVDIVTYRDDVISESDLIVPHPLIAERAFVLRPLQDIAPQTHIKGKTLDVLIAALGDRDTVPMEHL